MRMLASLMPRSLAKALVGATLVILLCTSYTSATSAAVTTTLTAKPSSMTPEGMNEFVSSSDWLWWAVFPHPNMPASCDPNDSEMAGWFIPYDFHVVEGILGSIISISIVYQMASGPAIKRMWRNTFKPTQRRRSWWDLALLVVAIPSIALIVAHKASRSRMWFLFQPCHVLHCLLIGLLLLPPGENIGMLMFNHYIHWLFGPFMGLVAADLACYTQAYELENWFIQHVLLLAAPMILVATRKYPLISTKRFFFHSVTVMTVYHYLVLEFVSLYSMMNLNFMMCPPLALLASFGNYYRLLMAFVFYLLGYLARYGLVGGFCLITGTPDNDGTHVWLGHAAPHVADAPITATATATPKLTSTSSASTTSMTSSMPTASSSTSTSSSSSSSLLTSTKYVTSGVSKGKKTFQKAIPSPLSPHDIADNSNNSNNSNFMGDFSQSDAFRNLVANTSAGETDCVEDDEDEDVESDPESDSVTAIVRAAKRAAAGGKRGRITATNASAAGISSSADAGAGVGATTTNTLRKR